jgi:hypothetical protein
MSSRFLAVLIVVAVRNEPGRGAGQHRRPLAGDGDLCCGINGRRRLDSD